MRALLINPWIYDFAAYDLWSKPLGILEIAARLKEQGWYVSLIDCLDRFHPHFERYLKGKPPKSTIYGDGHYYYEIVPKPEIFGPIPRRYKRYGLPKNLLESILKEEPEPNIILVTSGMTYWYPGVFESIKIIKKRFPVIPIVLGGLYARLCSEHAKTKSGADFVYSGNSYREILELTSKITTCEFDYSKLNDKHYPLFELYPRLSYITLRISRGCPFKCSYCGWYLLEDGYSREDPDFIVNEVEYFYKKYSIKNFSFYDDALLYDAEEHIIPILKELLRQKIRVNFHTPNGLNIRFLTPELAWLLKNSGFVRPRLGLESASTYRQEKSGQKTTNTEFLGSINYLKDAGYTSKDIGVYILMGLPEQEPAEVRETVEYVASTGARIFLEEYSPIPGTTDYKKSGLPPDADPLLHNNTAFPLYRTEEYYKFQQIKDLVHKINRRHAI